MRGKRPNTRPDAFGKRLVKLLENANIQRRGAGSYLAQKYSVSTVTANAWLNGEYKPLPDIAYRIANDHNGRFETLYFGVHTEHRVAVSNNETPDGYVRVPQLDMPAGAGPGGEMEGEPEIVQWLDVAKSWADEQFPRRLSHIRVLTARGDSMVGAGIMSGDLLFVDTGITRYDGDGYYVIRFRDGWQVKRLRADVLAQKLEIVSMMASREESREVRPEQEQDLSIGGKVAAWWTLRKH